MENIKLTIEGKPTTMPIHFGWGALRYWSNATGKGVEKMELGLSLEDTMWLLWAGLKQGARKAQIQFELDLDDVADIMDENPQFLPEAMELLQQSMPVVESPNPQAGAAPRKKKASR